MAAIDEVHKAHRDLLIRFAGMSTDTPTGYSALDTARDGWDIRWWILEPKPLKDILEQMQFEGGFVFRYQKGNPNQPQYIHIANSETTDATLSKNDISNINIKHSPFSELVTKKLVSHFRHSATGNYIVSVEIEVPKSTSSPTSRTKWNINAKENVQTVNLEMLVTAGGVGDTDPTGENRNANWSAYTNAIFGDIKLMVDCEIVNPYFYDLEVGSIVEFDENNMYPTTPMGHNSATWNNLQFIIVGTNRTPGKLGVELREI